MPLQRDSHIPGDGRAEVAWAEEVRRRYESYGWHVEHVADGGSDVSASAKEIEAAKAVTDKPSIIKVTTTIGYGSPNKGDTAGVHGAPLGEEEAELTRKQLGWNYGPFEVPQEAYDQYRQAIDSGASLEAEGNQCLAADRTKDPREASYFARMLLGELPEGWEKALPPVGPEEK